MRLRRHGARRLTAPAGSTGWSRSRLARLFTRAQGRVAGVLVLVALLAATSGISDGAALWSGRVFNLYQRLHPRLPQGFPVIIVEIDERSLREFGQWPWPRSRIATLVERIAADGALAIGFDILFTEPDNSSPRRLAASYPDLAPAIAARLAELPDTDTLLAQAIGQAPVVTARGSVDGDDAEPWRGATIAAAPVMADAAVVARLPRADALIHALQPLEQAASGFGVLTAEFDADGVVRRAPLAWSVDGQVAPALSVEMLRVALGANWSTLGEGAGGGMRIEIGELQAALGVDGSVRPWFGPSIEQRFLSAADVLQATLAPGVFARHLVLIGVTGLGTQDRVHAPLGIIDGIEVHAQVIENLLEGTQLVRPAWARAAELAASGLLGLLLVLAMPRLGPMRATLAGVSVVVAILATSYAAFHWQRLLLDPVQPASTIGVIFVVMLGVMLTEYDSARRALAEGLEEARLRAARMLGELRAAGEIQLALLTDVRTLTLPPELRAHALLEPARDVGGDLYDVFRIDERRLFFAVGDVTGKGVKASLFMAISKALLKSAVLRAARTPDLAMATANLEISRENPASLFVTAFAGIVDAGTGIIEFCNAGHENPLIYSPDGSCRTLENDGGPPLCVMDDFPYPLERVTLAAGETLLVFSDGVTEARAPDGGLLGREALQPVSLGHTVSIADPEQLVRAVRERVRRHEGGRRPTDDLTVVAIHFAGPAPATVP